MDGNRASLPTSGTPRGSNLASKVATRTDDEGSTMAAISQLPATEGSRKSRRSRVWTPERPPNNIVIARAINVGDQTVISRKAQNAHILPVAAALWNPAHASQVTA